MHDFGLYHPAGNAYAATCVRQAVAKHGDSINIPNAILMIQSRLADSGFPEAHDTYVREELGAELRRLAFGEGRA